MSMTPRCTLQQIAAQPAGSRGPRPTHLKPQVSGLTPAAHRFAGIHVSVAADDDQPAAAGYPAPLRHRLVFSSNRWPEEGRFHA